MSPSAPNTPTFMFSMKLMMRLVTSMLCSPNGVKRLRNSGSIWLWTPNAFSTEKLNANSGTMDSSVV